MCLETQRLCTAQSSKAVETIRSCRRGTHNTGKDLMSDFSQEMAGSRALVYVLLKTFTNKIFYTATFSQVRQTMNSFTTNYENLHKELLPSARALVVPVAPQQETMSF